MEEAKLEPKDIEVVEADGKMIDSLYEGSALTLLGLVPEEVGYLPAFLEQVNGVEVSGPIVHITGKQMDDKYKLKGDNKYSDDLNIYALPLDQIKHVERVFIHMRQVGCRWFDDVVDNNHRNGGLSYEDAKEKEAC